MTNFLDEDKEILVDFINESKEALENTELQLLSLEEAISKNKKADSTKIDTIFRTFHSIKGSAGFIGLTKTNKITHEAETLLDLIRKDKVKFLKQHIDIFLEVCDTLLVMMGHLNDKYSEDNFKVDVESLLKRIKKLENPSQKKPELSQQKNKRKVTNKQDKERKTSKDKFEEMSEKDMLDALITPEMKTQFIVDSSELLDKLEQDFLSLEKTPDDMELIENGFRNLHSLKGNAGFFNYTDINQICHKAETFLDKARCGEVIPDAKQFSLILQVLDFIRIAVDNLDSGKPPIIMGKIGLLDLMDEVFGLKMTEILTQKKLNPHPSLEQAHENEESETSPEHDGKIKNDLDQAIKQSAKKITVGNKSNSEVIRVDVNKLNMLMDLVGEIVISESMVSHNPELMGFESEGLEKSISYLQKNVRELQDLATSMRMIPLNGVFGKMKRLIRDLSAKNNKKIDLIISGGDTEVDRSVLENVSDPLVHILRNAADHGIELPEQRTKHGKNETGCITLEAKQVGGEILITIEDDGAGLNREIIIKKALEKGIISTAEAEMPNEKVWRLIFAPGFSTAEQISDISGRGVGMDVVLRNVEKIRGHVDIKSEEGKGTTIILRIPLTTAIVDGMILRVENSIYAIPTLDIKESIQVSENNVVDLIDGQEIIKIRESLIPVLRLHELHQLSFEQKPINEGIVVVTEKAGEGIGFLVDEILGQQQLVIKALPDYLGAIQGVSGCAILGDGAICLILDLANLIKLVETAKSQL